jgi:hypothetical protein
MPDDDKISPQEVRRAVRRAASPRKLGWEFLALGISVAFGAVIWYTDAVSYFLDSASEMKILASLLAGMFFTSIFTVAPATAALAGIAEHYSVFWLAFFGAVGSVLGDYLIFRFVRDDLSDALFALIKKDVPERWRAIFHLRIFHYVMPFFGALVIASPLPDEIGLAVWGLSKLETKYFLPLSYSLNFLGILLVGSLAKAVG